MRREWRGSRKDPHGSGPAVDDRGRRRGAGSRSAPALENSRTMRRTYPPIDRSTLQQMSASLPHRPPDTEPAIDLASEDGIAALVPRAQALLAAGDLAGYGALLALTQEIDDPTGAIGRLSSRLSAASRPPRRARERTWRRSTPRLPAVGWRRSRASHASRCCSTTSAWRCTSCGASMRRARCSRRRCAWIRRCPGASGNLAAVRRRQQELARAGRRGQAPLCRCRSGAGAAGGRARRARAAG